MMMAQMIYYIIREFFFFKNINNQEDVNIIKQFDNKLILFFLSRLLKYLETNETRKFVLMQGVDLLSI